MRSVVSKSKSEIDVHFIFHNVGQGLFYSGKIGDFHFIYDCGVLSRNDHLESILLTYLRNKTHKRKPDYLKLLSDLLNKRKESEVKYSLSNLPPKDLFKKKNSSIEFSDSSKSKSSPELIVIDLLILSHLHLDHVSGLPLLFNNKVRIKFAILPYLTPIERLMVALHTINLKQESKILPWFYDFLADPVSWLLENRIEKVILIGGESGHFPEDSNENYRTEKNDFYEMLDNDKGLFEKVMDKDNDPHLIKYYKKRLFIKNHNKNLSVKNIWFFRFFNYKPMDSQKEKFEKCIKKKQSNNNIIYIINNQSLLEELESCYKLLKGDFNNTSLVVFHGPVNHVNYYSQNYRIISNSKTKSHSQFKLLKSYQKQAQGVGHFLTGDIDLQKQKKWDEIKEHFRKYFPQIAICLIPHHGSKNNWNTDLLNKIGFSLWIASAGLNNQHHPNFEIMQEILNNGKISFFCHEFQGLRIDATLSF